MEIPTVYDNEKRYVFTNWTNEDFVGTWNSVSKTVKAGEYLEVPEYLAFHYTKHLVDREMMRDGKASLLSSDIERRPYESKTMTSIDAGMDSPALSKMKEQIKKEVEEEVKKAKPTKSAKEESAEFADIKA